MGSKLLRSAVGVFAAVMLFFSSGCTFFTQMSKADLAEYVAAAVAGGDQQALWDVLAPEVQDQFLAGSFNDTELAQKNLLLVIQNVCLKVHGIDPEKLAGDEELQKELAEKLEKDENFFVKINWLWYIGS